MSVFKLTIASLIPVLASAVFFKLDRDTNFKKRTYIFKQCIIGFIFGCISILGTEWGIPMNGVMVNSRDAAPLAAGLIFGGPAGIIAGVMGGVERWVSVYWGRGEFTRVACSVSTLLAGFYAAGLRVFLFDRKRPKWGMALGAGVVMEVFHLTMVLITNVQDATKAVSVIDTCLVPMVIANGLSVMLSVLVTSIIADEEQYDDKYHKHKHISPIFDIIQKWLLIVISISFFVTIGFDYILQDNMTDKKAKQLVETTVNEVADDISDASDKYMLQLARVIGREVTTGYYNVDRLATRYGFTEIAVVDKDGIIRESNNPDYIGFDMSSGEQSAEFLCLNEDTKEFVQAYGPITQDENTYRKFAGVALERGGFVQVSYDAEAFQRDVDLLIDREAVNRKVGETGGVIILDETFTPISITRGADFSNLSTGRGIDVEKFKACGIPSERELTDGNYYYIATRMVEGYYIVALYPSVEANAEKEVSIYVSLFSMLLVFAILFALVDMLIKQIVVNQVRKMADSLDLIADGNLNEVVDVRSNQEFASLSDDINATVNTLKRYIAEAAARIDKELEFAKSIQSSALPNVFPERDDFEIYCFMKTAKEVGGDFYDFYFTNDKTLNFMIADVSGKGIPAAMFMMRAKSVLRSQTERGLSVDDTFTSGNDELCTGNDAGMFVTAWQGTLDLTDGTVYFANAGHNLPAVKRKNGKYEFLKQKVNLVLAGMEGIPYSLNEMKLEPGDTIFLYTDGVTEATNAENVLFGDDRLLEVLNAKEYSTTEEVCLAVQAAIDGFVKEADQFDDITMVCLTYKGPSDTEY